MIMNVVGIFPDRAAIVELAHCLESTGIDIERLTVITASRTVEDLVSTGERAVVRGTADSEDQIFGKIHLVVPGLDVPEPQEYYSSAILEALSELGVPDGHTDTYSEAVDEGSCVAGLHDAREDAHKIKMIFAKMGGSRVEVF